MRKFEPEFKQLQEIFHSIEKGQSINGSASDMFLETKTVDANSVLIQGNVEGLLYLAECAVKLAQAQIKEKHFHFDASSSLDNCETEIILKYQSAPWEK